MKMVHQSSEKFPLTLKELSILTDSIREKVKKINWQGVAPVTANILIKQELPISMINSRYFVISCDIVFNKVGSEKLFSSLNWEIVKEVTPVEYLEDEF